MQSYRQAFSMGVFDNSGFSKNALISNTLQIKQMKLALLTANIAPSIMLQTHSVTPLRAIVWNGETCKSKAFEITARENFDNF